MTKLRRKRAERKPDGTVIPAVDYARELATSMQDVKSLTVELLARMELHKRDRRDMWHSSETGKPPLEWLQQLFEDVNNGRHEGVYAVKPARQKGTSHAFSASAGGTRVLDCTKYGANESSFVMAE
jgi:hypothetical protein